MVPRIRSDLRGFSLAEIMVAVTVLGLILVVAVPNFQRTMARARFERVGTELEADLHLAVSTARARGRALRLVFSESGYQLLDAADSTVIRSRDYGGDVTFLASTDPLIFPWGLVQPTNLSVESHTGTTVGLNLLPSGRVSHSGG